MMSSNDSESEPCTSSSPVLLLVFCGLPGSGKTTFGEWVRTHIPEINATISSSMTASIPIPTPNVPISLDYYISDYIQICFDSIYHGQSLDAASEFDVAHWHQTRSLMYSKAEQEIRNGI